MFNTLYECDNALTKEECDMIIDFFESNPEHQYTGRTGVGVNKEIKISKDMMIDSQKGENHKRIDNMLYEKLNNKLSEYTQFINKEFEKVGGESAISSEFRYFYDAGYQIQRTDPGGHYIWHNDFKADTARYLTFIYYLNDVPSENGGATEFVSGEKIQPKAGKFIMFPATWTCIHRGCILKSGVKYILTGWYQVYDQDKIDQDNTFHMILPL